MQYAISENFGLGVKKALFQTNVCLIILIAMKIGGREEIIAAATRIIAFSGLDQLTMQSLAEELGMNKASLYHWYRSKEEILEAVFMDGHRRFMSKGFRLNLEGSAKEVLTRAADQWTMIFSDETLLPYLRAVFSLRYSDPRAEDEAKALSLMLRSQTDVIISSLGKEDPFLSSLFAALLLQHLESILEGGNEDFRKDAEAFASLISETH